MTEMLDVMPEKGRQVRKEDGSIIPAKGCKVPNTSYYRRRLRDGDLVNKAKKTTQKGDKA